MNYIKSPLNYTGGKYKILTPILSKFPNKISTFVDLFAGGFNVGINVKADTIICNDIMPEIIELYQIFREKNSDEIIKKIEKTISQLNLSKENTDGYLKLRKVYNAFRDKIDLFTLICYSFNNQIRFNSKGEYNMPFGKGKSSFNNNIKSNLENFVSKLKEKNVAFSNCDFSSFDFSNLDENSLVYCDPPYLLGLASYNENSWNINKFKELLLFLDELNSKNIKFALSEVFFHKDKFNTELIEWSKKYNVHYINSDYSNCNYQLKTKGNKSVEVLITNY